MTDTFNPYSHPSSQPESQRDVEPSAEEQLAARLYGEKTPTAPRQPEERFQTGDEVLAEQLYGQPPTYVFTLPSDLGHLVPDRQLHEQFSSLAREAGLSQQQAQKLAEFHLRRVHDVKGRR